LRTERRSDFGIHPSANYQILFGKLASLVTLQEQPANN